LRHISAKIQPKNLKLHFDLGSRTSWAHPLATPLFKTRVIWATSCRVA